MQHHITYSSGLLLSLTRLLHKFPRHFLYAAALLFSSCGPLTDSASLWDRDIHPPVFYDVLAVSPTEVEIHLSEPARLKEGSLSLEPQLPFEGAEAEEESIRLEFGREMAPGRSYTLTAEVADTPGNTLTFIATFYGYNPRVPRLVLNEITTQGSSSNPDKVEILVLSDGNTAGVALFEGTTDFWSHRKVLPPVEVRKGEYLVVHCKPEGLPEERDETVDTEECTAEEAASGAWDFWIDGGSGLSGNNGVIALYATARGEPMDGFLYSNRTSSSDERYRGFGSSRALERADQLIEQGEWVKEGLLVAPEDAVDPEDSTATRSMCRTPGAEDTDSTADWHIVPTSGSSFGEPNTTEVYVP